MAEGPWRRGATQRFPGMEPPDSFVSRAAPEVAVVAALRRVGEGRERLIAVRDGVGVVDVLGHPWTFRSPDLKRRERLLLPGTDIYHNHPPDEDGSADDQSFSTTDVGFAKAFRLRSMNVVTTRFLFRLAPGDGGWNRRLGKGGAWKTQFDRIFGHALWTFEDREESLHRAWESFSISRELTYSRDEG